MMGSPPPPDAPSVEDQVEASAEASFEASPPSASLCGFGLPTFSFSLSIILPPFPPTFNFSLFLALNCDLEDPLDAEIEFGGGRQPTVSPDPDEDP